MTRPAPPPGEPPTAQHERTPVSDDAAVTVHIVDDDDSMRAALARLLAAAGYAPRGYASAGDFLIQADAEPTGCLLLDLHMPGPDGLALHDALQRRGIRLPTVFLSGRGDIASSVRALKAGASDFLTKPVQAEVLLAALRQALDADAPQRAERERRRLQARRFAALNARERAVLALVVRGTLTRQIAERLGVSERTVKSCRAAVMDKMGAATLPELVRLSEGLGDPTHADPVR
jgi:FixJ family two-component response regulator